MKLPLISLALIVANSAHAQLGMDMKAFVRLQDALADGAVLPGDCERTMPVVTRSSIRFKVRKKSEPAKLVDVLISTHGSIQADSESSLFQIVTTETRSHGKTLRSLIKMDGNSRILSLQAVGGSRVASIQCP